MSKLNLLPRGYFEITTDANGIIKGRFCTWSKKLFCIRKKINTVEQIWSSDENGNFTGSPWEILDFVADYLLCAVEYTHEKSKDKFPYSNIDACDWIDELGGIEGAELIKLMAYSSGGEMEDLAIEEEKKTQMNAA